MEIRKNIWPGFYEAVASGRKVFELRLADFECKRGDTLILAEWDPETRCYTGRRLEKTVASVTRTKDQQFWSAEDVEKYGFQIITFS